MDSDVAGSSNPGPDTGPDLTPKHGTQDPGPGGDIPGKGSTNPGPAEPDDAQTETGSGNPGPEE